MTTFLNLAESTPTTMEPAGHTWTPTATLPTVLAASAASADMEVLEATVETLAPLSTAAPATVPDRMELVTEEQPAPRSLAATAATAAEFKSHPRRSTGAVQATLAHMASASTRRVAITQVIPAAECTAPEATKPRGLQATWTTDAA